MGIKQRLIKNKTVYKMYILFYGMKQLIKGLKYTNQSDESKIYQISHRLERGLCLDKKQYKMKWGFRKANELLSILDRNKNTENDSFKIGCAVLAAFIREKEELAHEEEAEELKELKAAIAEKNIRIEVDESFGGIVKVNKEDLLCDNATTSLLLSNRHSCREFSDEPIDLEKLKKAIDLANRAPSSCNRQATDVYVIDAKEREKITGENDFGADKYLIICGKMDSYGTHEINDWFVSTGIFCGYLSVALQAVGIGSVFMRKEIISKSGYNISVREKCGIPDNQQIIIEMAIGNYCDSFYVPLSKRKKTDELLHF